ncbi:MAG: hypothetical protein AAF433_01960 [Bacteroidota bacterium]
MNYKIVRSLLVGVILLTACRPGTTEIDDPKVLSPHERRFYGKPDIYNSALRITARFAECGEWGGHKESISVSRLNSFENQVIYERYYTECEVKNDTFPFLELVQLDTFRIPVDQCKAIGSYSTRLLNDILLKEFPGHAGHDFTLRAARGGIDLRLYTGIYEPVESYKLLLEGLGLSSDHLTLESVYGLDLQ